MDSTGMSGMSLSFYLKSLYIYIHFPPVEGRWEGRAYYSNQFEKGTQGPQTTRQGVGMLFPVSRIGFPSLIFFSFLLVNDHTS